MKVVTIILYWFIQIIFLIFVVFITAFWSQYLLSEFIRWNVVTIINWFSLTSLLICWPFYLNFSDEVFLLLDIDSFRPVSSSLLSLSKYFGPYTFRSSFYLNFSDEKFYIDWFSYYHILIHSVQALVFCFFLIRGRSVHTIAKYCDKNVCIYGYMYYVIVHLFIFCFFARTMNIRGKVLACVHVYGVFITVYFVNNKNLLNELINLLQDPSCAKRKKGKVSQSHRYG